MKTILQIILILFLLGSCTTNQTSTIPETKPNADNDRVITLIKDLIQNNIDSCEVFKTDSVLNISIFSPAQQLMIVERNELLCDSILLMVGEKFWNYSMLKFHFIADTSVAEDRNFWNAMLQADPNKKSLEVCYVTRSMEQNNLLRIADKFNCDTYMSLVRIILNDCTIKELEDFQAELDVMNTIRPTKFGTRFITTVTDLGYKFDKKQDYSKELRTLQKMFEAAPILQKNNINLNLVLLSRMINTVGIN